MIQDTDPRRERAELRNILRFINKHVESLCENAIRIHDCPEEREKLQERVEQDFHTFLLGYPRGTAGVMEDFAFLSEVLKHMSAMLLHIRMEEIVKTHCTQAVVVTGDPTDKAEIERRLNDMLGFK